MKSTTTIHIICLVIWSVICIISNPCEAQRWRKVLDFPARSAIKDVVVLPNGDILSLISKDSIIIAAMDQQGKEKWRRNFGKGIGLVLESMDDHVWVGGTSGLNFSGFALLIKLTQEGNEVWRETYEPGFISAIAKNDDGYFLGGNLDRPGSSSNSVLYHVNASGVKQWMEEYDFYSNSGITAIVNTGPDLYMVLDASTVGVGFEGTVLIRANAADGQMIWWRTKALGSYENFQDNNSLLRPMEVAMNASNEIVISAPANVSNGMIYSYGIDGELTGEFRAGQTLPHALKILPNGDYIIAGILNETVDGTSAVVERRDPAGSIVWQRTIGNGSFFAIGIHGDTIIAVGGDQDFRSLSTYKPYIVKLTSDGRIYDSAIHFKVSEDLNDNCISDMADQPINDFVLRIDNRFFSFRPDGTVTVDVDTGSYNYKLDLPAYLQLCQAPQSIMVQSPDETVSHQILVTRQQCADLSVGMTYTELIRGEPNRFYVQYNNHGSVESQDVILNITLDDRLQLEAVSSDYMTTADGIQITIPVLPPNFSDRIQIDTRIDEHAELFSTVCIEASIAPHHSCDPTATLWNGPDLAINAECENNTVVFRVKNKGADMTETVPYELFADGFRFEEGTIQLHTQQEQIFGIVSGGSTISMRTMQVNGYPFNAVIARSIEACGTTPQQVGSQGMVRMFDPGPQSPYVSRACIEVRDEYSADRIFEIPRGLGRYHLIDSTQSQFEFSLMYRNNTEQQVNRLELLLQPIWQFDLLSFRELAASHHMKHELSGTGNIILTGENMDLAPGDQVQYRFALDLNSSGASQDYVSLKAGGTVNDSIAVNIFEAFYNRSVVEIQEVSPFVSINDGRIIGRGHTWEFDNDLHIQENGTIIYTGSTYEFGVDPRSMVVAMDVDNDLIWQHTYAFKEGGALLRKIVPAGAGRILLIGSIDDNQVLDNYITDSYACMLMLDENGDELWRKVWKPGNGEVVGGSLINGHFYHENKIILLGFRYTSNGPRQFLMETDINGDIHWIHDFVPGTDTWGNEAFLINEAPMKVSPAGNIFIVANEFGYESFILKLDEEANILDQSIYSDYTTDRTIYVKDFAILENEQLLLIGDGYTVDSEFNITSFGIIIKLNDEFEFIEEAIILDHFSYIELNAATLHNSIIFASGAVIKDSTSNMDALLIRSDPNGESPEVIRIADFGARDYANHVARSADGRVFAGVQTQTIDNFYNLQMGFFWAADSITSTRPVADNPELIKIFPNPALDVVNIFSQQPINKVMAYSMNGELMKLTSGEVDAYDVREFPAGMYLLVVYTSNDIRHIMRFVKVD